MNIAIILAAGKGERMLKHNIDKAFILVDDKPLLYYSLRTFDDVKEIDKIVLVVKEEYIDLISSYKDEYKIDKPLLIVKGGLTRQESVYNALTKIKYSDNDIVLIHDSARALVSKRIILDNIKVAKEHGACATAITSKDTILIKENDEIKDIPDRAKCLLEQTPASFKYEIIMKAHEAAIKNNVIDSSDDVRLVKSIGVNIKIVDGDIDNFKVTTEEDLEYLLMKIK
jgi:2-C-methyl-D-erythritol 4-phosphate cytidylyltransferase